MRQSRAVPAPGPARQETAADIWERPTPGGLLDQIKTVAEAFRGAGRATSGAYTVVPDTPGQWSEADEFRAQHVQQQMRSDASALAGITMLGSVPRAFSRGAIDPNVLGAGIPPRTVGPLSRFMQAARDRAVRRSELPMDEASRLARARQMNFYLDMPLGHGTAGREFTAFDPSRAGSMTGAAPARMGVWTELNPKPGGIADEFAGRAAQRNRGSPRVIPLVHRADRPASIALTGEETYRQIAATLAQLWDDGFDAVLLKNFTRSDGRSGSILVVKDPAQLRHPNAVFDPTQKDSRNLFAGFAGAGLFAPLAFPLAQTVQQPDQQTQ